MSQDATKEKDRLILSAARKRFAYYGFSKVTMDEIAGDVGLAKPSLYYYYPTKESLFRAVVAREHGRFAKEMEELLARDIPASQKLKEYADVRFRLFRELVNLNAPSFKSWSEIASISGDLFKNLEARELKAIRHILALGRSSGEFSCADPHRIAHLILHVFQGLRFRVFRQNEGMPLPDEAYGELRNELHLIVDVILQALQNHH
jgi:AcrR family transcriptional regulator